MQLTSYHSQAINKICSLCGAPFVGHPRRAYCSGRCKRRAREYRYKKAGPATVTADFYKEYGIVTPTLAHQVFEWMSADTSVDNVLIKGFTDPDSTTVPINLNVGQIDEGFLITQTPESYRKSSPRSVTAELNYEKFIEEELRKGGGTLEIVPPRNKQI